MATKWPSALTNRPSSSVLELLMGVLSTVDPPSEASEAVLFESNSEHVWFVVSTPLKNISQNRNLPQISG